jgi:hypothetical protein
MLKCFDCGAPATHYVNVLFDADQSFTEQGTQYNDDYTCQRHIGPFIQSHDVPGITLIKVVVDQIGRRDE